MESVILVGFLGAWLVVLVLWLRRAARAGSKNQPPEVAARLEQLAPKLVNRADCYGIDGFQLEGHGNIVLTDSEVAFLRWEPVGEWRLPLARVKAFDSRMFWPAGEKEYAGGTVVGTAKRRNALRIFWDGGYALFWTPERLQWLRALEQATGKRRGAEGIEVPLRPGGG